MGGDPQLLKSGELVERYQIRSSLGAGGMGQVYRAFDTKLRRQVALKILHPEFVAQGSDAAARMLREARAAAGLAHPNVVAIYDVGEVEEPAHLRGTTYLAMEFVPGTSLRSKMEAGPIDRTDATRWLLDVARALAAAHEAGLVHRDIKPDNVMLREDGVVKVLDFGIARRAVRNPASDYPGSLSNETESRAVNTITAQGVAVGTPLYMSPEQMRCERLDGRADQFSWGVMAYELLVGEPPWNMQGTSLQLVAEILSKDVSPPHLVDPTVPEGVSRIVARALEKDQKRRFPSMRDVVDALQRLGFESGPSSGREAAPISGTNTPSSGRDVVMHVHADAQPMIRTEVIQAPPPSSGSPVASGPVVATGPTTGNTSSVARPKPLWPWVAGGAAALVAAITGVAVAGWSSKPTASAPAVTDVVTAPPSSAAMPTSASTAIARINITIRATPSEASIQLDDGPMQPSPVSFETASDRSKHRVTVRAPGMADQTRTITYDSSQTLDLTLAPLPVPAASLAAAETTPSKSRGTSARAGAPPAKPPVAAASASAAPVSVNAPAPTPPSPGTSKRPLDQSNPYKD